MFFGHASHLDFTDNALTDKELNAILRCFVTQKCDACDEKNCAKKRKNLQMADKILTFE